MSPKGKLNRQNPTIPDLPIGSTATLINTLHTYIKNDSGFGRTELLDIIYKDGNGKKHKVELENPDYIYYYCEEPKYQKNYNRIFINKNEVVPVKVHHKDLNKDIAKRTGIMDWYNRNMSTGNYGENRKVHLDPNVFFSDMNLEDYYRFRFDQDYTNEPMTVTKCFFDIEADTKYASGDFPELGECPINAISMILPDRNKLFIFLLETNSNIDNINAFKEGVKNKSIAHELRNFIIEAVGGPEYAHKMGVDTLEPTFLFYPENEEIHLISDLFVAINSYMPDFVLAWNMAFDIPYIIERIKVLGYRPEDVMCHPDFEHKFASYRIDERNLNEPAEKCDYANIASYSVYMDQMVQFASRRKGQTKFTSYSLDSIGEVIAKVRKLDYKHITPSLSELPYKDYKTFVFYNVMDTIVQNCIEACTGDIDYIYTKCLTNNTRYSKGHRQTTFLANIEAKQFYNAGLIIGNNANRFNEKPKEKFPGAFVADPVKVSDEVKMKLNSHPVNLFSNLVDLDYSSLYPSEFRQNNMSHDTMIGALRIDQEINLRKENRTNDDKWTRPSQFMEDLESHEWLEFCSRWFNLPSYAELYDFVYDLFMNKINPIYGMYKYNSEGLIDPIVFDNPDKLIQPIIFGDRPFYDDTNYCHMDFDKDYIKEVQNNAANNQRY